MSSNQLRESTSPYLLQHADNPVHWRLWGSAALEEARAARKPILLSIGYAACHWCHVMAHESFEDPATADVINALFIPVKVDREERPDIDAIYMNALQLLGIPGGWPLTMFLTPDGEPFWGGTYYPPTPRYGQPAFADVLRAVHKAFNEDAGAIDKNRVALVQALRENKSEGATRLPADFPDHVAAQLLAHMDAANGGLGGAPKFPQTGLLELLWRSLQHGGDRKMGEAVHMALTHMAQGGIYDHLGGGYARYAVDERWFAPHFEKMLYDNAALIELMTLVWRDDKRPLYRARVAESVDFVLRELSVEGGFAASLDADSEGEEGRFYVWKMEEIESVLGSEAANFCRLYGVARGGNWEHGQNILNRLGSLELLSDAEEERLASNRAALFAHRAKRVRPGFDDKMLADWNGLMIAALARAGMVFQREDWIARARTAFDAVRRHLAFEKDGMLRLHQSYRAGRAQHAAVADGYANLARAALILAEAGQGADYVTIAQRFVASLDRFFWDGNGGGYFYTAADAEALIVRSRFAYDQPLPNANGVMIEVLTRLYHQTGEESFRERSENLIATFASETMRSPLGHGAYLNGASFARQAWQIVILGPAQDPATTALLAAAHSLPRIEKMILQIEPGAALPPRHPAAGMAMIEGVPTGYLCQGTRCSPPVTDPARLAAVTI